MITLGVFAVGGGVGQEGVLKLLLAPRRAKTRVRLFTTLSPSMVSILGSA